MLHPYIHAQATPDKPALICAGSGQVVTYKQLDDRSNQVAQLFRSLGLRAGVPQPADHLDRPAGPPGELDAQRVAARQHDQHDGDPGGEAGGRGIEIDALDFRIRRQVGRPSFVGAGQAPQASATIRPSHRMTRWPFQGDCP